MHIRIERLSPDKLQRHSYSFVLLDRIGKMVLRCTNIHHQQRPTPRYRNFTTVNVWDTFRPHRGERPAIPEDVKQEALQRARDHITLED